MKFFVFILGLSVALFSYAADTHNSDHGAHTKSHGKNKDWTHKRLEQVEHVMPQPVQDKARRQTPEMVTLTAPKSLSTISGSDVKLEWAPSQNAKVYHVQVSKDAGFNNRSMYVFNNYNVAETSIQVSGLEANTKYFWRVAAVNSEMKDSFTKSNFTSSTFSTK